MRIIHVRIACIGMLKFDCTSVAACYNIKKGEKYR